MEFGWQKRSFLKEEKKRIRGIYACLNGRIDLEGANTFPWSDHHVAGVYRLTIGRAIAKSADCWN
jgi:hypothetical protein